MKAPERQPCDCCREETASVKTKIVEDNLTYHFYACARCAELNAEAFMKKMRDCEKKNFELK